MKKSLIFTSILLSITIAAPSALSKKQTVCNKTSMRIYCITTTKTKIGGGFATYRLFIEPKDCSCMSRAGGDALSELKCGTTYNRKLKKQGYPDLLPANSRHDANFNIYSKDGKTLYVRPHFTSNIPQCEGKESFEDWRVRVK